MFHNPDTKEVMMFTQDPGPPWVKGRPPWQDLTQSPETVRKRAESMMKRVKEQGPTERELAGYMQLSETRRNGNYSLSEQVREKISKTLKGRNFGWREGRSKAVAIREMCDIVYVLKVTTSDGITFGKWGSTKERTFCFREKEFKRRGFTWEVIYWNWFGDIAPEAEAIIGRALHKHPSPCVNLNFFGKTECFAWTEETQLILQKVTNGLEESPAS